MEPTKKIWIDNEFVDWKEAKIHFLSNSLHYGLAVFEGIRCYGTEKGPAVFRLKEHVKRLIDSWKITGLEAPFSEKQTARAIKQTISENSLANCYIRPLIFLGYGSMSLNPLESIPHMGIAAWQWNDFFGNADAEKGLRVCVSSFNRPNVNAMMTKAKISGIYCNSLIAKAVAKKAGFDEAIMLDCNGLVSEGTAENIFAVRNGNVFTPKPRGILEGITRDSVIRIFKKKGIETIEDDLTRDQLYTSEEVFFTGTAAEIMPITSIDDRKIGSGKIGPITAMLREKFFEITRGKINDFPEWLDFVVVPE